MSALEQEILEKIQLLDRPAKQRVLEFLSQDLQEGTEREPFDIEAWLRDVERIRQELAIRTGNPQGVSAMDLLEEARNGAP